MQPEMFNELLHRIRPRLVKHDTTYRDDLEPGLKLAVTLRYLATGNSYVDLAYNFRVSNNSINILVPEVCQAILDEFVVELIPSPNTKNSFLMNSRTGRMCQMPVVLCMENTWPSRSQLSLVLSATTTSLSFLLL